MGLSPWPRQPHVSSGCLDLIRGLMKSDGTVTYTLVPMGTQPEGLLEALGKGQKSPDCEGEEPGKGSNQKINAGLVRQHFLKIFKVCTI